MKYYTEYISPLGSIIMSGNESELTGLWFRNQKYFMAGKDISDYVLKDNSEVFIKTKKELDKYFAGKIPAFSEIPLNPAGSDFRKLVWKILIDIPYGYTLTYKEIAFKISKILNKKSMSAQAIGGAVGHNPISIIIPCHRVIGSDGNLTGYAGGLDKKAALLKLEGVLRSKTYTNFYED